MTAKAIHQYMRDLGAATTIGRYDPAHQQKRNLELESEFYIYSVGITDPTDEEAQTIFHSSGFLLNGGEVRKLAEFICPGMKWQDNFRALSMEWGQLKLTIQRKAHTLPAIREFARSLPKSAPGDQPRDIGVSISYWHDGKLVHMAEQFCVSRYEVSLLQRFMEQVDWVPDFPENRLGSSTLFGNGVDITFSTQTYLRLARAHPAFAIL